MLTKAKSILCKIALFGIVLSFLLSIPAKAQNFTDDDISAIIEDLGNPDHAINQTAQNRLVAIGKPAVSLLIHNLVDKEINATVTIILMNIGQPAVDALILSLADESVELRISAADALGTFFVFADKAIPALIKALGDDNEYVRCEAAGSVGWFPNVGKAATPSLVVALDDEFWFVRKQAARSIGQIDPNSNIVFQPLLTSLEDEHPDVQFYSAVALGERGYSNDHILNLLIKGLEVNQFDTRYKAAKALGKIGPAAKEAIPNLIQALEDKDYTTKIQVISALGEIVTNDLDALSVLVKGLQNEDRSLSSTFALTIVEISKSIQLNITSLSVEELNEFIKILNLARNSLENNGLPDRQRQDDIIQDLILISNAVTAEIDSLKRSLISRILDITLFHKTPLVQFSSIYVLVTLVILIPIWLILLGFCPLALFWINEKLKYVPDIKTPWPVDIALPFRVLIWVFPFHYAPRVQQAWINKYIPEARKSFNAILTVSDRDVYVTSPVELNGERKPTPELTDYQPLFDPKRSHILIWGDGGTGKTSLACKLAKLGMDKNRKKRLTRHLMLPVLIEGAIGDVGSDDENPFIAAIRRQVQLMINGEEQDIPVDLHMHLLKAKRILVILDSFSEMKPEIRTICQPGYDPNFPVNAFIITSRLKEVLQGSVTSRIKPLRIEGNRLSSFMEAYLSQLGKKDLFDDPEFFDACRRLSEMVGEREVTALFARFYADQLIVNKEAGKPISEMPRSILDLMLMHLDWINRGKIDCLDEITIYRLTKSIAWENLKESFYPKPARRDAIEAALPDEESLDQKLEYLLRDDIRIIEIKSPDKMLLQITLDPLAEYLAAWRVIEINSSDETKWNKFLDEADKKEDAPEVTKGFLHALYDCILANEEKYSIPPFIQDELAKRISANTEYLNEAHRRNRIQNLITQLDFPEDQRRAIINLRQYGIEAKNAHEKFLNIGEKAPQDKGLRRDIAKSLGAIGVWNPKVRQFLLELIEDDAQKVRKSAVIALAKLSPDIGVLEVIEKAIRDPQKTVQEAANEALAKLKSKFPDPE